MFIDDSARTAPGDVPRAQLGPLHAYGAVIVPEESLVPYAERLAALRTRLGLPPKTEFKWNPGGGSLHKNWDALREARPQMLQDAQDLGISAVVVICATERMPNSWDKGKIQLEMLKYLYERVSMVLDNTGPSGILIADQPPGDRTDEKRWLGQALALTENGTQYIAPDPNRIVLPVLTARSDHLALLQLADLVTAATTALIAGSEHAAPYRDLIKSLLAKNWLDGMGGTGLKLFPDAEYSPHNLRNLFYWAFGEWGFSKVAHFGHKPLPHYEWAYATSDGLGNTLPPDHPYAKKNSA
ncbi:hypothetical protein [Streptomyces sp. GbtcB7]|uniref:hypothetical protein n=1 Tax=Streptomyces sp. GbtcB7 TaxID=2824752 RepID=UPI001C30B314|nr:hypothetical protein [Streptomyces sp. GbtcB7]